jgi:hypothetical protein
MFLIGSLGRWVGQDAIGSVSNQLRLDAIADVRPPGLLASHRFHRGRSVGLRGGLVSFCLW